MDAPAQIAIIIVSYNTRDLLLEAIASALESSRGTSIELVVVDNASADGSSAAARAAYPQVIAIDNATNRGFGAACNQAIQATRAPLVLLLNSDARLTPEALHGLSDCMRQHARCGAAGCRLINERGEALKSARNFLTPLNQALEMAGPARGFFARRLGRTHQPRSNASNSDCTADWVDGACLLLRRAALDEVGMFDERFFMYSEDEDLCYRLRQRGWTVCYSMAGAAVHRGAASSSRDRATMLEQFYRSQMLFLAKHKGRAARALYKLAMRTVLVLKRLLHPAKARRADCRQRLAALNRAGARSDDFRANG